MNTATLRQIGNATSIGMVAGLCVLIGASIARVGMIGTHPAERAAIVGIPVLLIAVVSIAKLGPKALPFWVTASVLAYPFLRYPSHRAGYITFDRVWIVGLLLVLPRLPRTSASHPASRLLGIAMVIFTAVYGARLLQLPPHSRLVEGSHWVDAMVLPIIVYGFTRRLVTREGDNGVIGALVLGGVVMSVISIAELVLGFGLANLSGGTSIFDAAAGVERVSGPYASNASSATAALVCLAAAVYWTRQRSGNARFVGLIAVVITAAGALASFHRAAGIGVVAILILGTVAGARNRSARYLTLSLCGIAAGVAFYVVSGRIEHSHFWQGRIVSNTNVLGRFASWDQGVAIFKQAPLLGVGPGQAPVIQQHQGLFEFGGQSAAVTIHSSFFTVLAENGLVGVVAFLLLCGAVVRLLLALRARQRRDRNQMIYAAVLAASVGYLVMSLTLTMLLEAPAVLFFAVLLGVAAGHLDRTQLAYPAEGRRGRSPAPPRLAYAPAARTDPT